MFENVTELRLLLKKIVNVNCIITYFILIFRYYFISKKVVLQKHKFHLASQKENVYAKVDTYYVHCVENMMCYNSVIQFRLLVAVY